MPLQQTAAAPSRLDKLSQLQNLDAGDEAVRSSRNSDLMHMLSTLYGIHNEEQMTPEKINALRASTAHQNFETESGRALLPSQVKNLDAQAALHNSEAEMTRKYDTPNMHDLGALWQAGKITDEDFYGTLAKSNSPYKDLGVSGMQRITDAKTKRESERAALEAHESAAPPAAQPTAYNNGANLYNKVVQPFGEGVMNMPSAVYNAAGAGWDYLAGLLGIPVGASRMHSFSDIVHNPYESYFYDPRNPEERRPLPVARSSQPTQ